MSQAPKWALPVAIVALLWNLLGCFAWVMDLLITPELLAQMPAAQQAMYEARPGWAVIASAVAVWLGALGCVGLIMRKGWALWCLALSLLGVIAQDIALFMILDAGSALGVASYVLQGLVLVVSVLLVLMARKGISEGWIS